MVASGGIKPVIDQVVPLEGAVEALGRIENREVIGKIIVTP